MCLVHCGRYSSFLWVVFIAIANSQITCRKWITSCVWIMNVFNLALDGRLDLANNVTAFSSSKTSFLVRETWTMLLLLGLQTSEHLVSRTMLYLRCTKELCCWIKRASQLVTKYYVWSKIINVWSNLPCADFMSCQRQNLIQITASVRLRWPQRPSSTWD